MKSDILVIKSIFLFFSLWGISMLLLWFRPRVEIFWKIVATLILAFYVWFFFPELKAGFFSFKGSWYVSILDFLREVLTIIFTGLFIIWPAALIRIFYKADDVGAEKLLKFLCLLTLVLWVMFIIYFFFSTGIDKFFYENLRKMVPHAK